MSAIVNMSNAKLAEVTQQSIAEYPHYEHKKFSKRRRSSACSCGNDIDNPANICSLDNCQKYKYFAASSAHSISIYNSVAGTYEIIQDPVAESSNAHDENDNFLQIAADANYEYVKADTFLENPLKHLLYIIRRTHRRVSSL